MRHEARGTRREEMRDDAANSVPSGLVGEYQWLASGGLVVRFCFFLVPRASCLAPHTHG
jgi:hypothetical protein